MVEVPEDADIIHSSNFIYEVIYDGKDLGKIDFPILQYHLVINLFAATVPEL